MPGGDELAGTRLLTPALILLVCLAGCRSPATDLTWQRIREQGRLRVGMEANWVPFEYVDGLGQLTGLDVELAQELGRRLALEIDFVANLSFDGLYDALAAGQVDMVISAVVVDMARSADFAYSVPYFDAGQVLVVGSSQLAIEGMGDLNKRKLAVELGSDGDTIARRWARRLRDLTLVHVDSAGATIAAVAAGRADAALTDRASALLALKTMGQQGLQGGTSPTPGLKPVITGEPVTDEQYAVVVRRESSALLRAVNVALVEMRDEGTLQQLERKWLGP